jgi:type II secretory pathway pseudopilin PulG
MHRSLKNLYPNKRHRYGKASLTAGFTLVEMIVAIGVFMISVIIIVGSLISLNNASRKARTERIAMDNLSAAIDSMSRSMRMGTSFHCGCGGGGDPTFPTGTRDCSMTDTLGSGGAQCIAFEGQGGSSASPNDQIVFRLFGGHLQRSTQSGALNSYLDMTAPEITITNLNFYLQGSTAATDQPAIIMTIRGRAGARAQTATEFNLQTSIAPRTPNF